MLPGARGGRKMLDPAVVALVRTLLGEGVPQRHIAARLGIARGSVHRIKYGLRREPGDAQKKPELVLSGCKTRCPGCGRKMHLPIGSGRCLACLREEGADVRPPIADPVDPPELGLELRGGPAMQARYQETRRRAARRDRIDPDAAGRVDEDAVREKQRRVEIERGDTEAEWRRVEEEEGDDGEPTPEDLEGAEN